MENATILKTNKWRISLLIFSPLFLLTAGYFILNQQNIIASIFNKYFSLTFTNALRLLATDNWVEVLLQNARSMVINIGVVLLIEIIVAVIALIIIFFFIYRIWKRETFNFGNTLVFSGYILIVIGMSIIGTIAISSTILTFTTVQGIINGLTPSELQAMSEEISTVLANSSLSSNQIFKDLVSILDQLEIVFARAGEVASIPGTIDSWWQGILSLIIYVIGVASISVLSILIGHVIEIWAFIKGGHLYQNYQMKIRKESFNERLLLVLEKQNEILEEMNKKTNPPVNRTGVQD
jgi:hypothetical protein